MSLIYGIVDFKKNRNVPEHLSGMKLACCPARFDDSHHWVHEHIGLGNILRYNTPESVFEKMPYTLEGITITAFARIDNRDDLFHRLNIPLAMQKEMPDSVLILKAYLKWKKECVNYIEGDWVFAIWDNACQELFIARDQFGNTGLYYYQSNDLFVFSSSIKGLFAVKEIPLLPNEFFIVNKLNSSQQEYGTTAYKNINMLPAAHTISIKNNRFVLFRYWLMENTSILKLKNADDYVQGFLELYKNAVKARLRSYGKVGSTLSGGLDSGSVSALAALELKKENKRLDAYTAVPLYDTSNLVGKNYFGDETFFATETARFSGNIDIHYIKGERVSVMEGIIKSLEIHDAPSHAASNAFWILEMMQVMQEHGISTMLTGQGGNASVSWTGMPAPETIMLLLNKFRKDRISLPRLIRNLTKLILPQPVADFYLAKRPALESLKSFSAINLDYARHIQNSRLMKDADLIPDFRPQKDSMAQRLNILKPECNYGGLLWQENSYAYDMHILDPTKDKQLTEYCLSIPDELHIDAESDRLIIRKAMENILPPKVQWNSKRGSQAADIQYRVRDSYSDILEILTTLEDSKLVSYYLDVKRLKLVLEAVKRNVNMVNNAACNAVLLRGISVGLFIKRFEH